MVGWYLLGGGVDDNHRGRKNYMVLYTVHPSGNWKQWGGGGTCIGKGGDLVRKRLYQILYDKHDTEIFGDDDKLSIQK